MLEPVPKALEFVVYVRYIQIQALIHITLTLTINSVILIAILSWKNKGPLSFMYHVLGKVVQYD